RQPQKLTETSRDTSLSEAREVNDRDRLNTLDASSPEAARRTIGPTVRTILQQGCRGLTFEELFEKLDTLRLCVNDVKVQSSQISTESRMAATFSLRRLESFLRGLVHIEGSKSMILISGGLASEDPASLDAVVRLAAAARTSVNVVTVELADEQRLTGQVAEHPKTSMLHD